MAVERSAHYERMSFEEYLALVEQEPEHAYEYLDGRVYMMTGGSPDHSIIGSNLNGLLQTSLRGRRCIVYNSDVYVQLSEHYRSCPSIQEYLLISSEFPLVEVFRREKQGFWSLYTLGLSDTIELNSLGLRFPVADVYQNTSFLEESNA